MIRNTALALFACCWAATAAYADNVPVKSQYELDKAYAQAQVNKSLGEQCLKGMKKKIGSDTQLDPAGDLYFNDHLSQMVYHQFYWNNSNRGVAFVMPVKAYDKRMGNVSTDIACFYSLTDQGLQFQLAQQILWRL